MSGSRASADLARLLLHHAAVGIVLSDPEGRLRQVNPAFCAMLGCTAGALLASTWPEILLPEDHREHLAAMAAVAEGTVEAHRGRLRFLRGDGEPLWGDVVTSCLRRGDGSPQRFVFQVTDISEWVRTEDTLASIERVERLLSERWQVATESGDVGIYDHDVPAGRMFFSEGYLQNLGYPPGSWSHSPEEWRSRLHPDDIDVVRAGERELADQLSDRVLLEYRMRHRDGSWRWLLDRGRVLARDAGGRPRRIAGTHIDITARRRAEDALSRLNGQMRLAARSAGIGFWEYDVAADRLDWDDEMLRIHGLTRREFRPTRAGWLARVHPEDLPALLARTLDSLVRDEGSLEHDYRILRPDGELRHIRSTYLVSRDSSGQALRMTGINLDISGQIRAEQQRIEALRAEQEREERQRRMLERKLRTSLTAAAVAHEINQPLSTILLHSQLAAARLDGRGDPVPPGELLPQLLGLTAEAERMVTIIEKMRMLLRNVETEHVPLDLTNVARSALLYLRPRLSERGVRVVRHGLDTPLMVEGDATQLQIAIGNVLRNALEALPSEGQDPGACLSLAVERQGDQAVVVVGDSGPGFSEEILGRLPLHTSKPGGTGLGLYVTRTALENHHGTIRFGRSALGGAEVRLCLPALGDLPPEGSPAPDGSAA